MTRAQSVLGVLGSLSCLVIATGVAAAQPLPLGPAELANIPHEDEAPFIDVLTFGVGEEIFERWGHAAICLRFHQPEHEPVCFDYGVTQFDAGAELVWTFLRGEQLFWVEPSSGAAQIAFYAGDEDRDIWRQTLTVTPAQARTLESRLWGALDERRRFYVYDHFRNNCATRIRDLIDGSTGGALRRGSGGAYPLTYRELGRRGLAELPALFALTDFVVGRQLDEHPTLWEAMFHPDVLRRQIQGRLGIVPRVEHARTQAPFPTEGPTGRVTMFLIALAVALLLLLATWRRRFETPARFVAALYLGTWGLIVYSLVIASPITGVRWNEAVLVVVPFDLALLWMSPRHRARYAQIRVAGLLLVAASCAVGVLHQPLWIPILTAIMPLSILAFRKEPAANRPDRFR